MKLAFNYTTGDLELNDLDEIKVVTDAVAELHRFSFFFDTLKGNYIYDSFFGNNSDSLVGLSDLTVEKLDVFSTNLKDSLMLSSFPASIEVEAEVVARDKVSLSLTGGGTSFDWLYSTKNGRLTNTEDIQTDEVISKYIIGFEEYTSLGDHSYNIKELIERVKVDNGYEENEDIPLSYRAQKAAYHGAEWTLVEIADFNVFVGTISLKIAVPAGELIRIEVWPTDSASIVTETNPYILRR